MADIQIESITPTALDATDRVLVRRGAGPLDHTMALVDLAPVAVSGAAADLTGTKTAAFISDFATAVAATAAVTANTAKVTNATHTGDVTGATALTIAADAVTYAKMQNVSAASKLIGRGDSGAGDPQEITLGSGLTMTGTTLSAAGGSSAYDYGKSIAVNQSAFIM